jgi:hypothetical protein
MHLREDIKLLLEGKELEKRQLNDNIAFCELRNERNHAINFLYFTGHLTYTKYEMINDDYLYNLKVPNVEISIIYKEIIENWLAGAKDTTKLNDMLTVLTKGDYKIFEKIFSFFILETLSYFDVHKNNEEALNDALNQIEEKKYETELISEDIKKIDKIVVTFDGKRCWLKTA